jgi:hypothetical protein
VIERNFFFRNTKKYKLFNGGCKKVKIDKTKWEVKRK